MTKNHEATTNMPSDQQSSALLSGLASERIAKTTGQAFYAWDIKSDALNWSDGFSKLIGLSEDETRHLCGRGFEQLLGSESHETRFATIITGDNKSDAGEAVQYRCVYLLQLDPKKPETGIWIEDIGCWYPDDKGRPMRAEGSVRVITERRNKEAEKRRKSNLDDLTGLPNRRVLRESIEKCISEAKVNGKMSAFLILSVERMNMINDVYGFESGDYVLKAAGEMVRSKLRAGDIVCRFSGSKFGVLLHECSSEEVFHASKRLLAALSEEIIETPGGHISASGVVGACLLPQDAQSANEAYHAAFIGMQNASTDFNNRVGIYSAEQKMDDKNKQYAKLSSQIVEALDNDMIELCYQPVVGKNYKTSFHEALVRVKKDDDVLIPAEDFIETVERLGLIRLVDSRVLELALKTLTDYPDAVLSINVSNDTVMDSMWLSKLSTGLRFIDNGASRLIVEITESMAVTDLEETRKFIESVKSMGCRVAIDDFGSGFTSFANLKNLPVDIVKIDGTFGLDLVKNYDNQSFVKSLIELTNALGMETVVEWIEDEDSALMALDWNADYLQGYHFGAGLAVAPWEKRVVAEEGLNGVSAKIDAA
ncbi:MAG: EAL domain-containing protein [Nitratireductor sp.]